MAFWLRIRALGPRITGDYEIFLGRTLDPAGQTHSGRVGQGAGEQLS